MYSNKHSIQILAALGCAAVLMLSASAAFAVGAIPVKVFLLGGQSNMSGRAPASGLPTSPVNLQQPQNDVLFYWSSSLTTLRPGSGSDFGPEITFGRTIADDDPASNFGLIKYAVGGTNLYSDWDPATGSTYAAFRSKVADGMAALTNAGYAPQIVGMLWTQGERDAKTGQTTAQYETNLNNFIADIRSRYGANLPFFLSELSLNQSSIPLNELNNIRNAQEAVAAGDPYSYVINTDTFSVKSDYLHFDAPGQMALGQAFGDSYIATTPEPATLFLMTAVGLPALLKRRRRRG